MDNGTHTDESGHTHGQQGPAQEGGVRETRYSMNQKACERANEVRARTGEQSTNKSRHKHKQQGPA